MHEGLSKAHNPPSRGMGWLHAWAPAAGLVAALLAAGCASGVADRTDHAALAIPSAWSSGPGVGAASSLVLWWRRFQDPLLVTLIDDALRANTSVLSAKAALAQSRALVDVQAAALGPSLLASTSAQRSHSAAAGNGNTFNAGFDASWEPDIFGAQHAAVAAARSDANAGEASLGDVQVSVAAEVAVDYMQLRGLQARVLIAQNNLQSEEETLQITRWRARAGLVSELEMAQAQTAAEQTRALVPALQTTAAQTEHALAVLTWRAPAALHQRLAAPADGRPTVTTPPDNLVLAFPAQTLRQRADVRAAEARVSAAAQRVTQADALRLPSFQLSGSLGLSALTLGALGNGASAVSSLLASISAPLFDGGALRAQARAQRASLAQAAAAYDASLLAALQDVEDSLVALAGDRKRLQSLDIAASAAHSAATLARQRFSSGLVDFQVVLDTQRSALATQDAQATAAAELNADHVRLYKALGGGWEPDEPARPAEADGPTTPAAPR